MSDLTNAAESMAAAEEPTPPTQEEAKALAESGKAEGTTPEEVAEVLKASGMKLPAEKSAVVDEEEGEDPDKPVADEPETPAEDDDADADQDEEEPAAKPDDVGPPEPAVASDDDKYSFQIEDAKGVTFKITADAKMEDILAEFEPKNNGQILDILNQLREVKDQKVADEAKAAEDAATAERAKQSSEYLKTWDNEAKALQGSKRIAEGADGEKRIGEVFKFMADENDVRIKAGKPTLNSFEDALDKLENKEARDKAAADAKAEKVKARENGGKVGGASAPASSGPSTYKVGSARNVNQAIRHAGLLD